MREQKRYLTTPAATTRSSGGEAENLLTADCLWDVKDVAKFLGLAVGSIYHMASAGRLPVVRISARCLKFRRSEILAWVGRKSQKETNVGRED
jgi:predicted DNA-binding transcriptional regulator AlpA